MTHEYHQKECSYCRTTLHADDLKCNICNYEFMDKKLFYVPSKTKMLEISYSDGSIPYAICYNLNITSEILYIELREGYSVDDESKITKSLKLAEGRYVRILSEIQNLKIECTEQIGVDVLDGGGSFLLTFFGQNNEELTNLSSWLISDKKVNLIETPKKYHIESEIRNIIPELDVAVSDFRLRIKDKYDRKNNYIDTCQEDKKSLWNRIITFLKCR